MLLHSVNKLVGYGVFAVDGKAGRIKDIVIDASVWTVQYIVTRRSRWLGIYDLLVPRSVIDEIRDQRLRVTVSKGELKSYLRRSGWGSGEQDELISTLEADEVPAHPLGRGATAAFDSALTDLRSFRLVRGALLEATDGGAGWMKDMIVNPATWHVMAVVISTRRCFSSKKLLPVQWIDGIDSGGRVHTHLGRAVVRSAPPFDSRKLISLDYVNELAAYYSNVSHSQ